MLLLLNLLKFGIPVIGLVLLVRQVIRFTFENDHLGIYLYRFLLMFLSTSLGIITLLSIVELFDLRHYKNIIELVLLVICYGVAFMLSLANLLHIYTYAFLGIDRGAQRIFDNFLGAKITKLGAFSNYSLNINEYNFKSLRVLFRLIFVSFIFFLLIWLTHEPTLDRIFANGLFGWPDLKDINIVYWIISASLYAISRFLLLMLTYCSIAVLSIFGSSHK